MRDSKTTKHLGIRLTDEQAQRLGELVADEQKRVGKFASVSASSFMLGLLEAEHERRFGAATPKEPTPKKAKA